MAIELHLEPDSADVLADAILYTLQNAPASSTDGSIAINEADSDELRRILDQLGSGT